MTFKRYFLLTILLLLLSRTAIAATGLKESVIEPVSGIRFPKRVTVVCGNKECELSLTGVAVRTKFFFKIYGVAHYMEHSAEGRKRTPFEEILADGNVKQITIEYVRKVSGERIASVLREDFERNSTENEYAEIVPYVTQVMTYFRRPVNQGDIFIMRWLPQGNIYVELNGKKLGHIQNRTFARVLWSIWFGENAVVDRKALVARLTAEQGQPGLKPDAPPPA